MIIIQSIVIPHSDLAVPPAESQTFPNRCTQDHKFSVQVTEVAQYYCMGTEINLSLANNYRFCITLQDCMKVLFQCKLIHFNCNIRISKWET